MYLSRELPAVQKRAMRIIFPCFSYEEALVKVSLFTLSGTRQVPTDNIFSKLRKLLLLQNTKYYNLGKSHRFNPAFETERFRKVLKEFRFQHLAELEYSLMYILFHFKNLKKNYRICRSSFRLFNYLMCVLILYFLPCKNMK